MLYSKNIKEFIVKKKLYNKIKQDLGVSDSINEYIEVLLRQFENTSHDENSFQSIATRFGIKVNDVPPQVAISRIREYYIISVYQVFEDFLNQMHKFLIKYGVYKENKDSSTSMLKHIHVSLVGMREKSETAYLYYIICDYYRLVRNLCTHTDNIDKVTMAYQNLCARKEEIVALFPKLQVPNKYDEVKFDDFIFYSRAVKKLAEMYVSNTVYDIDKVIENYEIKRFRVFCKKPKRLRRAIETDITFSFCMKPEIVKVVVDKLIEKF